MIMLWIKALHIVAVVTWFSALFYLPRLFVYHAMSEDTVSRERFKVMERKLYRGIAIPSMIAVLLLGAWTASYNWSYYSGATWFWLKMALVGILLVYHHMCGFYLRSFAEDRNQHGHRFFRWFNELPVLLLVSIVLLVVVKAPA
jgi:putative membrane protein